MAKWLTYGFAGMLLMGIVLAGCSNADNGHGGHGGPPTGSMIEVALSIEPQLAKAGQEVVLQAELTQDAEKVEDADEVMFEVRRSGADESTMILGEHAGNGVYTASHTFPEAATYFITAHATARGMHNMPTLEVNVTE